MKKNDESFLQRAIELAQRNMEIGGGPFGAVIVENNKIVAESGNEVRIINDPTAHAEIQAIRKACKIKDSFSLENCVIYSSCEPCPMCLSAIYWARISKIYFAATRIDAAKAGFDDNRIYSEINKDITQREIPTYHLNLVEGKKVFEKWIKDFKNLSY